MPGERFHASAWTPIVILLLLLLPRLGSADEGDPPRSPPERAEAPRDREPAGEGRGEHAHDEAGGEHGHAEHGHADHGLRFHLGADGRAVMAFEGGEWKTSFGGHVFFEVALVHGALELEIGLGVLKIDGGVDVPIDVLLKKPWHVARWCVLYAGAGPTVVAATGPESGVHFGGAMALGAYLWFARHVGFHVEANLNLIEHDGLVTELGGTGGLAFGF